MSTLSNTHPELWPRERVGYEDRRPTVAVNDTASLRPGFCWARWETRLATLVVGAGLLWAAMSLNGPAAANALWQTPGPMEACALGALVWLHAQWRRSVH